MDLRNPSHIRFLVAAIKAAPNKRDQLIDTTLEVLLNGHVDHPARTADDPLVKLLFHCKGNSNAIALLESSI